MLGGLERAIKKSPTEAVILASLLFAGNTVLVKVLLEYLPPMAWVTIRFGLVGLFFTILYRKTILKFTPKIFPSLALDFILSVVYAVLFYVGLSLTSALNAAILTLLLPIFVYVGSVVFLREPRSNRALVGSLVSFTGGIMLFGAPALEGFDKTIMIGNGLMLLAFMVYAWIAIHLKKLFKHTSVNGLLGVRALATGIAIGITTITTGDFETLQQLDLRFYILTAVTIIFAGIMAQLFYFNALKYMRGEDFAPLTYIEPLAGAMYSVVFLGDVLDLSSLVASIVIIAGVMTAHPVHVIRYHFYISQRKPFWRKIVDWIDDQFESIKHSLHKYF